MLRCPNRLVHMMAPHFTLKAKGWFTIYPLRPVASRPNRKSLFFQWTWTQRDAGIELDSIPASKPIEKIMTSGRDATRTIYCEPALNLSLSVLLAMCAVQR